MALPAIIAPLSSLVATAGGIGIGIGVSTAANPLLNAVNQKMNEIFPIAKPTSDELIDIYFKRNKQFPKFDEWMRTWGINEEVQQESIFGKQTLQSAADNIIMFRRQLFDSKDAKKNEEIFFSKMEQIAILPDTAKTLLTSTQEFESVQEIILWLVREVLDPAKRKQLRLDEDFPEAALIAAKKLGMPPQRMRDTWAGHWVLAAIEQLAESLHRYHPDDRKQWEDEITQLGLDPDEVETGMQDLLDNLKFNDVAPFYRQQLASTAFNNLGRIETRWMIRFRFAELEEATYLYKRLGLPATMAKRVAQVVFVVQSITDWKDGIKQGAFSFDDVKQELKEWGIDKPELLAVVQRKVSPEITEGIKDERDFTKAMIQDQYFNGLIDRDEVIEFLIDINFSEEQAKVIFEVMDIKKQSRETVKTKKERDISKSDVKRQFLETIIDRTAAIIRLKTLNFSDRAAKELLVLWEIKKENKA